jgi:hypothetical protein
LRTAVFYVEFWVDFKNGLEEDPGRSFKRSKHWNSFCHEAQAGGKGGARTRGAAGLKRNVNQFARIDIRKQSFAVRAVEKWNRVPDWVRVEEKPDFFKRQLKKAIA